MEAFPLMHIMSACILVITLVSNMVWFPCYLPERVDPTEINVSRLVYVPISEEESTPVALLATVLRIVFHPISQ